MRNFEYSKIEKRAVIANVRHIWGITFVNTSKNNPIQELTLEICTKKDSADRALRVGEEILGEVLS